MSALLDRIRKRLYPETIPVLASWWLKTVFYAGHNLVWWRELDAAIGKVLAGKSLDPIAADALADVRTWIQQSILSPHKPPEVQTLLAPPFRPDMTLDEAKPFLFRVLNEWLPAEMARLLTAEAGFAGSDEGGMPALEIAKILERLLVREHFSPATLELLLEAAWSSPKCAYPADVEIFSDVVLSLLGRTAAPAAPVLPAMTLAGRFAEAVEQASLVVSEDVEELRVPLDDAEALELFRHDALHIGSILVTMDGRTWQSVRLQSGPESVVVYRPVNRLRIDFSSDHARLLVPWTDSVADGRGAVHLPEKVALFGREWRGRALESDAGQTWLHLEFSGILPLGKMPEVERSHSRRLRPASIEMAWSEVAQALAAGTAESIDGLHREDLIPLAAALERLVDGLRRTWPSRADIERLLMSVRYLQGAVAASYGPIPWRVLPEPARRALLKRSGDAALTKILSETFDGVQKPAQTSPTRAA